MKTNKKHALVSKDDSIKKAVHSIDNAASGGGEPGIAIVVDDYNKVLGVVTDGDIRDSLCRCIDFLKPVAIIMSTNFVYVYDDLSSSEQLKSVLRKMSGYKRLNDPRLTKVIVCKRDMEFVDIVNLFELYKYGDITLRKIAVYGMGHVGLTLALTFAELNQFDVTGIDINKMLIEKLKQGVPSFYEDGLHSLIKHCISSKTLDFKHSEEDIKADIHIISVGTPIDKHKKPVYSYLEVATKQIGRILKEEDMIIYRSTVPVGTTRNYLIPLLEASSGLKAGKDFFIAFAPERTVEGNALKELKILPQIIGGYSSHCSELSAKLFQKITPTIINVESLEAAEIIKLIDNTFRDTVFSFANEVALICDKYNLDAFEIIESANEGYPRNNIPCPSPGVGGICLSKDPYLYTYNNSDNPFHKIQFGYSSRPINEKMPIYIYQKFKNFADAHALNPKDTKVFIVGLTFKGFPETSDTRFSPAIDLINLFKKDKYIVQGFDWVLTEKDIEDLDIMPVKLEDGIKESNAVFVMNNHPQNTKFNVYNSLIRCKKPFYFFDGWRMFSKREIETIPGVIYGTLGYVSTNRILFVTEIHNYDFKKEKNSRLTIYLPKEEEIIPLNQSARDRLEKEITKKPLLWAAGGGAYIFGNRYIPLVKRSADSPSNPDKLTIATGLTDSYEEMINPLLLIRELFEEIIIIDEEGHLLIPKFTKEDEIRLPRINQLSEKSIKLAANRIGISWNSVRLIKARIESRLLKDEVRITCENRETVTNALIHFDRLRGNINLLFAVHIPELEKVQNLHFYDTESKRGVDGKVSCLNREIFLYNIKSSKFYSTKNKELIENQKQEMTPHAEYLISYIKQIN